MALFQKVGWKEVEIISRLKQTAALVSNLVLLLFPQKNKPSDASARMENPIKAKRQKTEKTLEI